MLIKLDTISYAFVLMLGSSKLLGVGFFEHIGMLASLVEQFSGDTVNFTEKILGCNHLIAVRCLLRRGLEALFVFFV